MAANFKHERAKETPKHPNTQTPKAKQPAFLGIWVLGYFSPPSRNLVPVAVFS